MFQKDLPHCKDDESFKTRYDKPLTRFTDGAFGPAEGAEGKIEPVVLKD